MGLLGLDEFQDHASSPVDLREQYENAPDENLFVQDGPADVAGDGGPTLTTYLFFIFPVVGFFVLVVGACFLRRRQVRQDAEAIQRYHERLSFVEAQVRLMEERRMRLIERALVTTRVMFPKSKGKARGRTGSMETDVTVATDVDDSISSISQRRDELEGIDEEEGGTGVTKPEREHSSSSGEDCGDTNFATTVGPGASAVPENCEALLDWQGETCSICLEPYREHDEVSWSKHRNCAHAFHTACITSWLRNELRNDCPYCRGPYLHVTVEEEDREYFGGGSDSGSATEGADSVGIAEGAEPAGTEVVAEGSAIVEDGTAAGGGDANV
ncbi:hypothetical protein ACHAXT_007491 [Thalassiosira profunda]